MSVQSTSSTLVLLKSDSRSCFTPELIDAVFESVLYLEERIAYPGTEDFVYYRFEGLNQDCGGRTAFKELCILAQGAAPRYEDEWVMGS